MDRQRKRKLWELAIGAAVAKVETGMCSYKTALRSLQLMLQLTDNKKEVVEVIEAKKEALQLEEDLEVRTLRDTVDDLKKKFWA